MFSLHQVQLGELFWDVRQMDGRNGETLKVKL